jgi:hypothetical protein
VTWSGEKPGGFAWLFAPTGIEIDVTLPAPVEVATIVEVAQEKSHEYEEFVAIPLTRKYPSRIGIMSATTPTTPKVSFGGA